MEKSKLLKLIKEELKKKIEEKKETSKVISSITNDKFEKGGKFLEKAKELLVNKYNVDPSQIKFDENTKTILVYDKPSTKKVVKISKEDGESIEDYEKRVAKIKDSFNDGLEKYKNEEWREVTNNRNRYTRVNDDVEGYLEVSDKGHVKVLDLNDGTKSRFVEPKFSQTRNAVQVHIGQITCPTLKGMIVDAFPDKVEWEKGTKDVEPQKTQIVHKNGDLTDCSADNLKVVLRGKNKIEEIVSKTIKKVLSEGGGAGYDLIIDGMNVDRINVLHNNKRDTVGFIATLKSGEVEWSAEGYYDGVSSEGIYYDGVLVMDYESSQKRINGGNIKGYVYIDDVKDYVRKEEIDDEDVIKYVKEYLTDFKIKKMIGAGWIHVNLDNPIAIEDVEVEDSYNVIMVYIEKMMIEAPEMVEAINWYFENVGDFDEIFGNNKDED